MLKTLLLSIVVVLVAPLAAGEAVRSSHVVLISVDGLPADYLDDPRVALPKLRRMAKEGARAERMLSVFPTVTWPNHTSIVTGVMPARHGVVGNRFFDRAAHRDVELLWDPTLDKQGQPAPGPQSRGPDSCSRRRTVIHSPAGSRRRT